VRFAARAGLDAGVRAVPPVMMSKAEPGRGVRHDVVAGANPATDDAPVYPMATWDRTLMWIG
jgi:hypothetical protein